MGGSHSHPPPIPKFRALNLIKYEDKDIIKTIIERPLSKINIKQQWKLILNNDKNTFKLKNVDNNKYLFIGQEPKEGIPVLSTIDLINDNYKNDPAYVDISNYELENKTDFSFISTFGTQLDIIDKNENKI